MSQIEWTDETWNPVTGCSKVSEGCRNCYAEKMSLRFGWSKKPWTAQNAAENVVLHPDRLDKPIRWRKPRNVFVNSMSDLFHDLVEPEFIKQVFRSMSLAHWHKFQVLTKRPARMSYFVSNMLNDREQKRLSVNVWLGTSVEDQKAKYRIDAIRDLPCKFRFLSCEPLLEDLGELNLSGIHWVITGAESGPGARPMNEDWVRNIRDQCLAQGVAFFYKQKLINGAKVGLPELDGKVWNEMPQERLIDRRNPHGNRHKSSHGQLL